MSEQHEHDQQSPQSPQRAISRRLFLKGSGASVAASGLTAATLATGHPVAAQEATPGASPAAGTPGAMAGMPGMQASGTVVNEPVKFFTAHQFATVDALVSRILPGTADDPGAHEAGVVGYIDGQLAGSSLGYTLKTYNQGPFLVVETSPTSVEASSQPNIYQYVLVAEENVARYGFQSVITPQDMYRRGLEAVDTYANTKFQKDFVDLSADQQDQILTDMEAGKASGFDIPSDQAFFTQLRNDTIEGMFSDPMYGGNQNMVGWKLVGYPGAVHFYSPADLKNQKFSMPPQSLGQMVTGANQNQ